MNNKYDLIVVGGGPARSTAAFFLTQAGSRVLVLEKETLPRYKACGGVSASVLEQFPYSFESVIGSRAKAFSFALGPEAATIPLPDSSVRMVMRKDFDDYLWERTGAEIRQDTRVRAVEEAGDCAIVETEHGARVEASHLMAADGANSMVARSLGLRTRKMMAGAIEVEASVPEQVLHRFADKLMFIFGEVSTGYL